MTAERNRRTAALQRAAELVSRPLLPPACTGLAAVVISWGLINILTELEGPGLLLALGICYALALGLAYQRERKFQDAFRKELERLSRHM